MWTSPASSSGPLLYPESASGLIGQRIGTCLFAMPVVPLEQPLASESNEVSAPVTEGGIRPQSLVFLTDLYGSFPPVAPAYPVLWASTGSKKAPFGEVIPMRAA